MNYFNIKTIRLTILLVCMVAVICPSKAEVIYALPLSGSELAIGNMLEWSTAEEIDSDLFVVQRSVDGVHFTDIQKVDAAGLSEQQQAYHFLDLSLNNQKAYYRLKQIDTDGSSSLSQTVIIQKNLQNHFMVMSMSSPAAYKHFEVAIDCAVEGAIAYQLTNISGDVVADVEQSVGIGLNTIVFDLEHEPEGVYRLDIQMGEEHEQLIIRKVMDELIRKPNVASKNDDFGG